MTFDDFRKFGDFRILGEVNVSGIFKLIEICLSVAMLVE